MSRTLTATVGLPGSGKSSWTRAQVRADSRPWRTARLNRDSLRLMLHDGRYAGSATEHQVIAIQQLAARACFERNATRVIIDDTNLEPSTLNEWRDLAIRLNARFEVRSFLDVPIETCVARDALRRYPDRLGEDKIREMWEDWGEAITVLLAHWRMTFDNHAVVVT